MGHTKDAKGALTINSEPKTMEDFQAGYDRIEEIGGLLKLTKEQREELTADEVAYGWLVAEIDTGSLYMRLPSGWRPLFGGKTTFTPSWSNFIPGGSSTVVAWYQVVGSRVEGFVRVTIGSGFTMNTNDIALVPPVAPAAAIDGKRAGSGTYAKAGTGYWEAALLFDSSGNLRLVHMNNEGGGFYGGVKNSTPFGGWTAGDVIMLEFSYEV